jgi:hypothetical protein
MLLPFKSTNKGRTRPVEEEKPISGTQLAATLTQLQTLLSKDLKNW